MSSEDEDVSFKRLQLKYKRADRKSKAEITELLRNLSISDQVLINRNANLVPKVIIHAWRLTYGCLDIEKFQQELTNINDLRSFLKKMQPYFHSVRLDCEQLQEQLNILDSSGFTELPNVLNCEIDCESAKKENYTQWPLKTLPKLFTQLEQLTLKMPIEVGFIEQFSHLTDLALYDQVSAEALSAIWSNCKQLRNLQLLGNCSYKLTGIFRSDQLRDLTLTVAGFKESGALEILPQLHMLELRPQLATSEETVAAISLVITERPNNIKAIHVHGSTLGIADWLPKLDLPRCSQADALVLIDMIFGDMNMSTVGKLPVLNVAFWRCNDLKDRQVLDLVTANPQLKGLYLKGCPLLTTKLLYNLFNMRCIEKLQNSQLVLTLPEEDALSKELKLNFDKQTTLGILDAPEEDCRLEHVQFFFHQTEKESPETEECPPETIE